MDRRTFLTRSAVLGAATTVGATGPWAAVAAARTRDTAVALDGTTLASTLTLTGDGPYRRFSRTPGWPIEVRADLAEPRTGREDRREALATLVHLTDIHVLDAQSTTRVEFTDRLEDEAQLNPSFFSSAWRPQETLTGHIADAMIRALREVGAGPVTGRPYDCAVSTGDATDNAAFNEIEWMIDVLDGGRPVQINSGDPDRYEGVQDHDALSFDASYYHPGEGRSDNYKDHLGYPTRPELLDLAITAFTPVGLPCPWYTVYGNHDGLVQGNAADNPAFRAIATGPLKVVGLPSAISPQQLERAILDGDLGRLLTQPGLPARLVTPDDRRAFAGPADWVRAHREDRGGPGPVGHGLSAEAEQTGDLHYTFPVADGVLGIALDSVNRTVFASGSLSRPQVEWLEAELIAVSSRYLDADGAEVTTDHDDQLVVLFAHHTTGSMDNPFPDLNDPRPDDRVLGDEFIALLHRFPNVVAFVAGHTHVNRVFAHPHPDTGGFWEINTAAHIDAPQHSRIVELVDNRDGTLSLFGTLVDHAGPAVPPDVASGVLDLASLARELAANDRQKDLDSAIGTAGDRNVELLLTAPFERRGRADADPRDRGNGQGRGGEQGRGQGAGAGRPDDGPGARPHEAAAVATSQTAATPLPVTGGLGPAAVGATLLAGAAALRGRSRDDAAPAGDGPPRTDPGGGDAS